MTLRWRLVGCLVLGWLCTSPPALADDGASAVAAGQALRRQGHLALSISKLRQAYGSAATPPERMQAAAELGASLVQARRLDEAQALLLATQGFFQGPERARVALDLGNLASLQRQPAEARRHYSEALALGAAEPAIRYAASLNLLRLAGPDTRLAALTVLAQDLAREPLSADRVRWQLNLGQQARLLGSSGARLAEGSLEAARQGASVLAKAGPEESALLVEALDALAQWQEDQQRMAQAQALTRQGLAMAAGLPEAAVAELRLQLEWRQARLARALQQPAQALAAYRRAAAQAEALRQDMPLEDGAGGSSFQSTLAPLYQGLVEALLQAADGAPPEGREAYWREVLATLERLHQSELQDYLGDRCEVDAVKGGTATLLAPGTAVLYPLMLEGRLELLLQTASGITHQRVAVGAQALRETAMAFARQLRRGEPDFLAPAQQLYDWLLRPLEAALAAQQISTLVAVPDGALRLVAMGAFHDGSRFAVEKFALATVTGLSMTNTTAPARQAGGLLLAGLSDPGPVVDKLSQGTVARLLGPQAASVAGAPVRALGEGAAADAAMGVSGPAGVPDTLARRQALQAALALPGVDQELDAISRVTPARRLLNAPFTLAGFQHAAGSGDYGMVHVASHGVFGGTADASYILAYDDLLTLDGLQALLRSDGVRRHPIELLSLSACETAEGNDRAPLGLSGAAIKARAQAVMGALWPVADAAAVRLMAQFYAGLRQQHLSKAQALQRSQAALLNDPAYAHPFFWAPFILLGNWL